MTCSTDGNVADLIHLCSAILSHSVAQFQRDLYRQVEWSSCRLSGELLAPPVVADYLGRLYNKDAVLEFLLGRNGHFADSEAQVLCWSTYLSSADR